MKILVATDGSEQAMKAVEKALDLAEKGNDTVFLLAVAYYSKEDLDEMPFNIQDKLEAEARQALQKAKELFDKKDIKVDILLETDLVPANAIIRKAKELKCDQILMGSTGRTGLARAIIGSTAAKVVSQAPCTVTVIR
jgi:nucleotide-binding universal stress UspA family protein